MRVSDVQRRLRQLSDDRNIPELSELADHLSRRRPDRVAPIKSATMTDSLRRDIRAYAAANPTASQMEIGRKFNVNPGRISEALRGVRQ
jgi:hypothetical protein